MRNDRALLRDCVTVNIKNPIDHKKLVVVVCVLVYICVSAIRIYVTLLVHSLELWLYMYKTLIWTVHFLVFWVE